MAVTNSTSAQLASDYRSGTVESAGKLRIAYFKVTTVAGDANSTADLCDLPKGKVRVLPGLSRISTTAMGTGMTMDVGHAAYVKDGSGTQETADVDAFIDGMDVSAAVNGAAFGTGIKYDLYSTSGLRVTAKFLGAAVDADEVIEGYIVYVQE